MILYCGDPHGQFRHIVRAAAELNPSAVVLLGDLEPQRPLHEELEAIAHKTWFIHGNHDTDTDQNWEHLWGSALAGRNIDGRVVELPDGTRLAGLGGVFRESVWYPSLPTEPRFRNCAEHAAATPLYDRWRENPESVDQSARDLFATWTAGPQDPGPWTSPPARPASPTAR